MGPGCGTARQSKHGRPFNLQHCGLRFDLLQHLAQELLRQVLEPSVIEVVMGSKPTTGLMEKDASLIEFGRELFSKHVVAAGTYARVVKVFGERDLVDLVAVMGQHASEATMLAAFDQHLPVGQAPLSGKPPLDLRTRRQ
jgi:hypothetical protein